LKKLVFIWLVNEAKETTAIVATNLKIMAYSATDCPRELSFLLFIFFIVCHGVLKILQAQAATIFRIYGIAVIGGFGAGAGKIGPEPLRLEATFEKLLCNWLAKDVKDTIAIVATNPRIMAYSASDCPRESSFLLFIFFISSLSQK